MRDQGKRMTSYYAGLSIGPAGQFTGLAVLEKHFTSGKYGGETDTRYAVRHLARFPPGTAYGQVVEAVRLVFADPPVKSGTLVIDQTGVGRAVFESFRDAKFNATARGVTVSAGHIAAPDERGGWLVPKKDLVGVLQVLLQEKRMKVAPALEQAKTLAEELQQFQMKAISLDPAAVEWRERPHDDLVLAVAVAAWQAERPGPAFFLISGGEEPEPHPRWVSQSWSRW
jgi:hypothetical protein